MHTFFAYLSRQNIDSQLFYVSIIMTLYVKPISALLTRDTQLLSNMDPYVVVQVGHQKKKTHTHQQGGKKPQWKDVLTFNNVSMPKMIITVMDEDIVNDDIVGSATYDLTKVFQSQAQEKQYISLTFNGRSAGKLYVSLRYVVNNQQNNYSNNGGSSWGTQNSIGSQQNNWGAQNNMGNQQANWGHNNISNQYQQQPSNWSQNNMGSQDSGWGQQQKPQNNSGWGQQQQPQNNSGWGQNNSGWGPNQQQPQNNSGWGPNNNGWGNLNEPNINQNSNQNIPQKPIQNNNLLLNALQTALQGKSPPGNQQNQPKINPYSGW